ncbi:MAG: hypothetical protein EOP57_01070 [Sphingomonadales bacterium]|nr:MAG: hypothetical protein EOP57_01070 [Sphingomonadales bacterium]
MATSVFDLGAHTYVDEGDLLDPGEGPEAAAITQALVGTDRPTLGYLVISADVDFLRLYGPQWFSFAALLQTEGLGLVIAVIGPGDEVTRLIEQSREMIARIGRFRHEDGGRTADAVIFVPLPDPRTPEAKTYYACARHLIALPLIEATGAPVLIVDADQAVEKSVEPFVRGLARHDVGVIGARGLGGIWPWRRHMAGSGWFNATLGGQAVLRTIGRYIRANLHRAPSWTLDQNAVSFALEAHPEATLHIDGSSASPFIQPSVRSQQEKLWRARKAAMAA